MKELLTNAVLLGAAVVAGYYAIIYAFTDKPRYRGTVLSIAAMPDHWLVVLQTGWSKVWLRLAAGTPIFAEIEGARRRVTPQEIREGDAIAVWSWRRAERQELRAAVTPQDPEVRQVVILE